MKTFKRLATGVLLALAILATVPASAKNTSFRFTMVRSKGLANFPACAPHAIGVVQITSTGPVEVMNVFFAGLPPNTGFDFFVIQAPNSPFGLSWYQGDIECNAAGTASGTFIGRFSIETFIVAPDVTSAPVIFGGMFPSVATNPKTGPVQLYHLGLWFDSPAAAFKAGGPNTETPFNGEHNAGVQVLNTSNFTALGPLSGIQP